MSEALQSGAHRTIRGLRLAPGLVNELRCAARRHAPDEACGLLLASGGSEGAPPVEIVRAPAVPNRAADARRAFRIDPLEFLAHDNAARRAGLRVAGTWHSHPTTAAVPSAADLAALWPEHLMLIVGRDGEVRAWRRAADGLVAVPWGHASATEVVS